MRPAQEQFAYFCKYLSIFDWLFDGKPEIDTKLSDAKWVVSDTRNALILCPDTHFKSKIYTESDTSISSLLSEIHITNIKYTLKVIQVSTHWLVKYTLQI